MSGQACATFNDVVITFDIQDLLDMGIPAFEIDRAIRRGEFGEQVQGSLKIGWPHAVIHDWITVWGGDKLAERTAKQPPLPSIN